MPRVVHAKTLLQAVDAGPLTHQITTVLRTARFPVPTASVYSLQARSTVAFRI